jgi:hypothetical protein
LAAGGDLAADAPWSPNGCRQVALLIRALPSVAAEDCFAMKGGTAINLFVRDLPRLSVDIDLTYLPVQDRAGERYRPLDPVKPRSGRLFSAHKSSCLIKKEPKAGDLRLFPIF